MVCDSFQSDNVLIFKRFYIIYKIALGPLASPSCGARHHETNYLKILTINVIV